MDSNTSSPKIEPGHKGDIVMKYYTRVATPFWDIILVGDEDGLSHLQIITGPGERDLKISKTWERNDAHFADIKGQLLEYINGHRTHFDIRLNPQGTTFQKQVWDALYAIPFGETRTYKDIAVAIGNPKACRAVGMANAKNPIPIIVPCHRVIGSNGKLTGFASGLTAKAQLLKLEGIQGIR